MSYQRLLNKEKTPSQEEIIDTIGDTASLWLEIHEYIEDNYDFVPELKFFAKNHGWTIRYRKSGKTLVYFFPEDGAFSILLVLGKKEADKVEAAKSQLNGKVKTVFENTEQLHDGRWLWIRVQTQADIESIKLLLKAKRKPRKVR